MFVFFATVSLAVARDAAQYSDSAKDIQYFEAAEAQVEGLRRHVHDEASLSEAKDITAIGESIGGVVGLNADAGLGIGGALLALVIIACICLCFCRKKLAKVPCCKKCCKKKEKAVPGAPEPETDGSADSVMEEVDGAAVEGTKKKKCSKKCIAAFCFLTALLVGLMVAMEFITGESGGLQSFMADLPIVGELVFADGGPLGSSEESYLTLIVFAATIVCCSLVIQLISPKVHKACCGCAISIVTIALVLMIVDKFALGEEGGVMDAIHEVPVIRKFVSHQGPIGKLFGITSDSSNVTQLLTFSTTIVCYFAFCCCMMKKMKKAKKADKAAAGEDTGDGQTALEAEEEATGKKIGKCKASKECCMSICMMVGTIIVCVFIFDTLLGEDGGFQNLLGAIPVVGPALFKDGGELFKLVGGISEGISDNVALGTVFANLQFALILSIVCVVCQKCCKKMHSMCCKFLILIGVILFIVVCIDDIAGQDTVAGVMENIPGFSELESLIGENTDLGESGAGSSTQLIFIIALSVLLTLVCCICAKCCSKMKKKKKADPKESATEQLGDQVDAAESAATEQLEQAEGVMEQNNPGVPVPDDSAAIDNVAEAAESSSESESSMPEGTKGGDGELVEEAEVPPATPTPEPVVPEPVVPAPEPVVTHDEPSVEDSPADTVPTDNDVTYPLLAEEEGPEEVEEAPAPAPAAPRSEKQIVVDEKPSGDFRVAMKFT